MRGFKSVIFLLHVKFIGNVHSGWKLFKVHILNSDEVFITECASGPTVFIPIHSIRIMAINPATKNVTCIKMFSMYVCMYTAN